MKKTWIVLMEFCGPMSKHGFVFQLCDVAKLAIIDKKVHPLCQMLLKK
jgi:hypothetical protein